MAKQGRFSTGELEVLEDLKAVATIAVVVGIRYAHLAYNEGNAGKLIISALHFLIAGFMYSITFDTMVNSTDLDISGNFSDFVNHNDYDL